MKIKNKQDLINAGRKADWSDNAMDVSHLFLDYVEANMDKREFKLIYDCWIERDGITEIGIELENDSFYVIGTDDVAHPAYLHNFIVNWLAEYGITDEWGGKYCYGDYLGIVEEDGLFGVYYSDTLIPAEYTELTSGDEELIPLIYDEIYYEEKSDLFICVKERDDGCCRIKNSINRFGEIVATEKVPLTPEESDMLRKFCDISLNELVCAYNETAKPSPYVQRSVYRRVDSLTRECAIEKGREIGDLFWDFINSKNVREHCRCVGRIFTPLEWAVLIALSDKSLLDRISAYERLLPFTAGFFVREKISCTGKLHPLRDIITEVIDRERLKIRLFEKIKNFAGHMWSKTWASKEVSADFESFDVAVNTVKIAKCPMMAVWNVGDFEEINYRCTIELTENGEVRNIYLHLYLGDFESASDDETQMMEPSIEERFFHKFYVDVPVPFKFGDKVYDVTAPERKMVFDRVLLPKDPLFADTNISKVLGIDYSDQTISNFEVQCETANLSRIGDDENEW